jgi:hypothetical protein
MGFGLNGKACAGSRHVCFKSRNMQAEMGILPAGMRMQQWGKKLQDNQ